tara:strand:- start:5996 stop:6199 length:204 start_codon:yes stop_codon:yes gene_type:complete
MKITKTQLRQIIKEELEHSIQLATFHLADAMMRAGLHVVQGEDTLTIDLGSPFAGTMVKVKVIEVVD